MSKNSDKPLKSYEISLRISVSVKAKDRNDLQKIFEALDMGKLSEDKNVESVEFKESEFVTDEDGDEFELK